jgi:prevent-host-death family protein
MKTVTALEAKKHFGDLLDRVARGEEVVITRHDKPVARTVSEGDRRLEDIRRVVEDLHALRKGLRLLHAMER